MKKRLFLIPSLLAAGLLPQKAAAVPKLEAAPKDPKSTLFKLFALRHEYTLAGHRSHSSHSSHSSHRSSGGGGYSTRSYSAPSYTPPATVYEEPAPVYRPPASTTPTYRALSTPDTSVQPAQPDPGLKVLPGNSDRFKKIVMQVQTALYVYGYYTGTIDGVVGPQTKIALTSLQTDYGLKATGTITPETLNALNIAAQ